MNSLPGGRAVQAEHGTPFPHGPQSQRKSRIPRLRHSRAGRPLHNRQSCEQPSFSRRETVAQPSFPRRRESRIGGSPLGILAISATLSPTGGVTQRSPNAGLRPRQGASSWPRKQSVTPPVRIRWWIWGMGSDFTVSRLPTAHSPEAAPLKHRRVSRGAGRAPPNVDNRKRKTTLASEPGRAMMSSTKQDRSGTHLLTPLGAVHRMNTGSNTDGAVPYVESRACI